MASGTLDKCYPALVMASMALINSSTTWQLSGSNMASNRRENLPIAGCTVVVSLHRTSGSTSHYTPPHFDLCTGMVFASSTRAAEDSTRRKGLVGFNNILFR